MFLLSSSVSQTTAGRAATVVLRAPCPFPRSLRLDLALRHQVGGPNDAFLRLCCPEVCEDGLLHFCTDVFSFSFLFFHKLYWGLFTYSKTHHIKVYKTRFPRDKYARIPTTTITRWSASLPRDILLGPWGWPLPCPSGLGPPPTRPVSREGWFFCSARRCSCPARGLLCWDSQHPRCC